MIGSFSVRGIDIELNKGGVFVAIFDDAVAGVDIFLVVIKEEVAEGDRSETLGVVFFEQFIAAVGDVWGV